MYVKLEDVRDTLIDTYRSGYGRGWLLEFKSMHEPFSVVLGSTLYIYGAPATGKTQIAFELMIQMSMLHGWRHAVCSPETGDASDIYAELIQMVVQKDLVDTYGNQMTEAERLAAEVWVSEHFFVVPVEKEDGTSLGLFEFYDVVDKMCIDLGISIQTTLADPFDEFDIDWGKGQRDIVLEKVLIDVRKNAKKTTRYNIITTHLRDQQKEKRKVNDDWVYYYPPPDPQDIRHGQEWYRRGMTMLGAWRPPTFLKDEDGIPYNYNSLVLSFGKQKPKQVKKQKSTIKRVHLYWDDGAHRYYEKWMGQFVWPQRLFVEQKKEIKPIEIGLPDI